MPLSLLAPPLISRPARIIPAGQIELDRSHPLASGLVALYPLRNDLFDIALPRGTKLLGTVGYSNFVVDTMGLCINMVSASGYTTSFSQMLCPTGASSKAISIWMKHSTPPSSSWGVCAFGGNANGRGFGINIGSSGSNILQADLGNAITFNGTVPVVDGLWHHVVLNHTAANTTTSLYVDGVLDTSYVYTLNTQASNYFFARNVSSTYNFQGGFASFYGIWNRELSLDEIQHLYREPYALVHPLLWRSYYIIPAAAPSVQRSRAIIMA